MRASARVCCFCTTESCPLEAREQGGGWQLLEDPRTRMIAVAGARRLQAPARRGEDVRVLELPREVRAVGKPRLVGYVGHRAVGILDQPVGVAHPQLTVERGGTHANMLPAQALELPRGE